MYDSNRYQLSIQKYTHIQSSVFFTFVPPLGSIVSIICPLDSKMSVKVDYSIIFWCLFVKRPFRIGISVLVVQTKVHTHLARDQRWTCSCTSCIYYSQILMHYYIPECGFNWKYDTIYLYGNPTISLILQLFHTSTISGFFSKKIFL